MIASDNGRVTVELTRMEVLRERLMSRNSHLTRLLTDCVRRLTLMRQSLSLRRDIFRLKVLLTHGRKLG